MNKITETSLKILQRKERKKYEIINKDSVAHSV